MKRAMQKRRSIEFMAWVTICGLLAVVAAYAATRPLVNLEQRALSDEVVVKVAAYAQEVGHED